MLWPKYISVALASTLKFVGGPLAGWALGLSWLETASFTLVGMMLSVVVVTFLGQLIQPFFARFRKQKPRLFSKRTRLAVKVWKRFGMTGIALLTPLLFTPIGGTVIALSFKVPRTQLLLNMLFWGAIWAFLQTWLLFLVKY